MISLYFSGEISEIQCGLARTLENPKELKGVGREDFGGREELNMCHHMANST
jgi:hypothetical protein